MIQPPGIRYPAQPQTGNQNPYVNMGPPINPPPGIPNYQNNYNQQDRYYQPQNMNIYSPQVNPNPNPNNNVYPPNYGNNYQVGPYYGM
jgi:hypothetical protein